MKSGSHSVRKNHAELESSASPTRGVQKLKRFLGQEATALAQPKTAKDVVPTLSSSLYSKKRIRRGSESKGEEDDSESTFLPQSVPSQGDACLDGKMNHNHTVGLLLEKVLLHLHSDCSSKSARQLSQSQCKAIRFLSSDVMVTPSSTAPFTAKPIRVEGAPEGKPILVKRVVLSGEGEGKMFDLIAIAALQRAARIEAIKEAAGSSSSTAVASKEEQPYGRCLYVLTHTNEQAKELSHFLTSRYHLDVVLADSSDAPSFPTLPASFLKGGSYRAGEEHSPTSRSNGGKRKSRHPRSRSPSPSPSSAASPSFPSVEEESESMPRLCTTTASAWTVPVFVGSPDGFLSTDPRSAVWRCVGAFVVLASDSAVRENKIQGTLLGSDTSTLMKLSQHRWACLGHTARTTVLASSEQAVVNPKLDWLISVKPSAEILPTSKGGKGVASAPGGTGDPAEGVSHGVSSLAPHSPPLPRAPVQVRYVVLEGLQRMQFLYALIQGLTPGRGMVVRVATREMCVFLFDVLYGLLDQLPPFLRLFSDYQGERESSGSPALPSHTNRQQQCEEFDDMVEEGRYASVLFTCFDLVPQRGSIWLQFDLIPDMLNYSSFLAHRITPSAFSTSIPLNDSPQRPFSPSRDGKKANHHKEEETRTNTRCSPPPSSIPAVEVVQRTVSRKRSRSPVPLFVQSSEKASPSPTRGKDASCTVSRASPSSSPPVSHKTSGPAAERFTTPTNYSFVFILFRPSEVNPALKHLRATGARFALEYIPLAKPPSLTRFLFIAEKIRSFHRTLFQIQNAAYNAYKATMTVYCTIKPRDVYDEEKLDLKKVAAEFGYEELPLLDLRLKDTPFRPKEDFWKASKMKAVKDRRAYKKFADTYIEGEGPAPLENYTAEKSE